jgi:glycosyltransferase involved in cell wall biosynthesis
MGFNYSVIIPHHNTPDLLRRCIDSIPQRDDLEIIIVDDNSDENIVDFSCFPGKGKKNTKIIFSKEGRGAGFSRNCGVREASGIWLIFADADDYFTSKFNDILDKYTECNNIDVVFFNALKINEVGRTWNISLNDIVSNYIKKKRYSEQIIRYGYWTPWSRMFKRHIVVDNNVVFEELPTGNDMMFVLNSTKYAKNIAVEEDVIYMYYFPTGGSQTMKKYTKEYRDLRAESRLKLIKFHKSVNYPFVASMIPTYNVLTDISLKPLLKKYNYKILPDVWNFVKIYVAKKIFHLF